MRRSIISLILILSTPTLAGGPVHTGDLCQLALVMERYKHTTSVTRRNTEDAYNQFWNLQHNVLNFDREVEPSANPVNGQSLDGKPALNALEIAQRTEGLARRYLGPDDEQELAIGSVIRGEDKIREYLAKYDKELRRLSTIAEEERLAILQAEMMVAALGGMSMLGNAIDFTDYTSEHPASIDLMQKSLEKGLQPGDFVFDSLTGKLDREFIKRFWISGLVTGDPNEWRTTPVAAGSFFDWLAGNPSSWVLVDRVLIVDEKSNLPQPVLAVFIRTSRQKPKYPRAKRKQQQDTRELNPLLDPNLNPALVPIPIRPNPPRK